LRSICGKTDGKTGILPVPQLFLEKQAGCLFHNYF